MSFEDKQEFLRTAVLEKGYKADKFAEFISEMRDDGL